MIHLLKTPGYIIECADTTGKTNLISSWEQYRLWEAHLGGPDVNSGLPQSTAERLHVGAKFGVIHGWGISQPVPAVMTRMRLRDICAYIRGIVSQMCTLQWAIRVPQALMTQLPRSRRQAEILHNKHFHVWTQASPAK